MEVEEERTRPPESPRREGKRREDEDYFVVEASSNELKCTRERATFPRCRSTGIQGVLTATLCLESLNLVFPSLRTNLR